MYDIVRKFSSGSKINFSNCENKLHLESDKSVFNLNCISASEFPLTDENFNENEFSIKSKELPKILNVNFQFQTMRQALFKWDIPTSERG